MVPQARYPPQETAESVSKDKRAVLLVPHVIDALTGKQVVKITAGQWHSCAITRMRGPSPWGGGSVPHATGRLGIGRRKHPQACVGGRKSTEGGRKVGFPRALYLMH